MNSFSQERTANDATTDGGITDAYDAYAAWTDSTALDFPNCKSGFYLALGIVEEVGELQAAHDTNSMQLIISEAGDVLWYAARYAKNVLNLSFSIVCFLAREHRNKVCSMGARQMIKSVGVLAGIEKKRIRDGADWDPVKIVAKDTAAKAALIEIISNVIRICEACNDASLLQVMCENKSKLERRKAASTLHGDGDNR